MIEINLPGEIIKGEITLPASKSISNRALIIRALSELNYNIDNLSTARDTEVLIEALASNQDEIDIGDAGTAMRFLTAFFAIKNRGCILTGSERMKQRPIGILIDGLREIGAEIKYLDNEGFPPLKIESAQMAGEKIKISGDVSSQYISAIMMIAPLLHKGIIIEIIPPVLSLPYLKMTASLMEHYGVSVSFDSNQIVINQGTYKAHGLSVESDWSAASYFYGLLALSKKSELKLKRLNKESWQGDSTVAGIYNSFGVETMYYNDGIVIRKTGDSIEYFEHDFKDYPDLVPAVAVTCAGLGIECNLKGLDNLNLKESKRIEVLATEISRLGIRTIAQNNSLWIEKGHVKNHFEPIPTYQDHRIAMAFATLSPKLGTLIIENESVVNKSYPAFWKDLTSLGFEIKTVPSTAL